MDAAVELAASQQDYQSATAAARNQKQVGFARKGGWSAYEDGAALECQVDAGAADLAAGAQRRDDHLVALPPAGGRALPRLRGARRGDGRHSFPLPSLSAGDGGIFA